MTLQKSEQLTFQESIFGVSDSPARIFQSQVTKNEYEPEQEAVYSTQLQALSGNSKKKINPLSYSLKMLKTYLASIGDGISPESSLNWMRSATMQNGNFSTLKTLECHKTAKECFLSQILEEDVPEKYFLSEEKVKWLISLADNSLTPLRQEQGGAESVGTYIVEGEQLQESKIKQVAQMYGTETEPNPQAGRIYSADGISPTLDTCSGGNRMPKIAIPVLTPDRAEKRQNGRRFKANGRRTKGLVKTFIDLNKNPKKTPVARCLKARYNAGVTNRNGENSGVLLTEDWNIDKWAEMMVSTPTPSKEMLELSQKTGWRIRKLTPRECWRLQGFPDWAFERAREAGVSDSQLYKQAGNSVTVNVIKAIGERL